MNQARQRQHSITDGGASGRLTDEFDRLGIEPGEACSRARVDPEHLNGGALLFEELVALATVCGRCPSYFFDN